MHSNWTARIVPSVTSELEIQKLIYTFGTHIEIKKLEEDNAPKTDGTALLASEAKSLRDQVAALLSATPQGDRGTGNP